MTVQIAETQADDVDEAKRLRGRQLDDALYAALLSRSHSDMTSRSIPPMIPMT